MDKKFIFSYITHNGDKPDIGAFVINGENADEAIFKALAIVRANNPTCGKINYKIEKFNLSLPR